MSRVTAQEVLDLLEKSGYGKNGVSAQAAEEAFTDLLDMYDIPITVEAQQDEKDVIVSFLDEESMVLESVVFSVSDEDVVSVHKLPCGDDLDEETEVMDLSATDPMVNEDGTIDFSDAKWNKAAFQAIFNLVEDDSVDEKMKTVIRGGKKVKIKVNLRKKKQTAKQKAASRKRKGKKQSPAQIRKRMKSMKLARKLAG